MPEYRTHGEPLAIATGCEVACNIPIGEHAHGVYCVLVYDCGPALESTTFVWTVGPTPSSSLYVVPAQPDVDVSRYVGVGWGRRRCRGTGKWWTRHRRAASIPRRAFKPWMAPVRCVTDTPRTTARRKSSYGSDGAPGPPLASFITPLLPAFPGFGPRARPLTSTSPTE